MRVAFYINHLVYGGAERLVHDIVNSKVWIHDDLTVILGFNHKNNTLLPTLSKRVKVVKVPGKNNYSPIKIINLARIFREYDVVHVNLFPCLYFSAAAKFLCKNRAPILFYTEHSTLNNRRKFYWLKPLENYIYKAYEKIFCITDAARKNLGEWQPDLIEKLEVIENGINLNRFLFATNGGTHFESLHQQIGKIKILMVANFREQKDHATLIKAMTKLPERFHCFLVGEGETQIEIARLVSDLMLTDRIHFLGASGQVPQIMKNCDIFVLSSFLEGFGLVAIEAMASKLPVIVSKIPGLGDIVGNAALTFPVGNSEKLAELISAVGEDINLRNRLIEKGFTRAKKFDIEIVAERYRDVFVKALEQNKQR